MALARVHNYPLHITATTLELLQQAVVRGIGDGDHAALFKLWGP